MWHSSISVTLDTAAEYCYVLFFDYRLNLNASYLLKLNYLEREDVMLIVAQKQCPWLSLFYASVVKSVEVIFDP